MSLRSFPRPRTGRVHQLLQLVAWPLLGGCLVLSGWGLVVMSTPAQALPAPMAAPPVLRSLATRPLAELVAAPGVANAVEAPDSLNAAESIQALPDGGWRVHSQGQARSELVRALAGRSGNAVSGPLPEGAMPAGSWRLATLAEAWQLLLGPRASYALHCQAGGACRVMLVGAPAAGASSALPGTAAPLTEAAATPAVAAPPQPDPPGLFPAE